MKARPKSGAWRSYAGSVALHAFVVGLVGLAFILLRSQPEPQPQQLGITATVVQSAPAPRREAPRPPPAEEPPPEPQPDEAEMQEQARREEAAREQEQQRLVQEAEQERQEQERVAQEQAEREKAEREKADRDKAAKEKADREKAAAAAAAAQAQREAELNARIAAEERLAAARASGLMDQYVAQITARIERAWIRPPSARPGLECEVRVTQVPGGAVIAATVTRCNGDAAVRESIEAAVYRASPLPLPPDPALFERNLLVTFRPED